VLDQRLLQIHRLNTVATHVWMACDGRHSPESIAGGIERRFRVDGETALRDVNVALELFARAGLLETDAAGVGSLTNRRDDNGRGNQTQRRP
jgi:hypothetical protein